MIPRFLLAFGIGIMVYVLALFILGGIATHLAARLRWSGRAENRAINLLVIASGLLAIAAFFLAL